ncbi:MAG: T9SS type A sorting domain-containing protein, partial [bacterium]
LSRATWVVPEDVFTNDAYLRVVSTVTSGLVQQDSAVALTIRPPLLQNRSFEEWDQFGQVSGPPDDWVTSGATYGTAITVRAVLTPAKVAEGDMAAQVDLASGVSATLFQEITDITVGTQYTFSCRIFDDAAAALASLRLTALNASNTLITANGSASSEDHSSYVDYSVTLTAPTGTKALQLEILLESTLSGTLYLDDVRLDGVEPDPVVTILGPPQDTVFTYDGVTKLPIRWTCGETASVVKTAEVDVSYDNGSTWDRIVDLTDSDITYFAWTGADTFSIDTRIRVTATNSSGARNSDSTGKFVIRPSRRQVILASGWHLFSLPLTPADPSVQAVLGDDLAGGAWVYEWSGGQYLPVDTLQALHAYWLALDQAATVNIQGEAATSTIELDLDPGWFLMLNPYPSALRIDSLAFVRNGIEKIFSEAVLEGWVAGQLYGFDPLVGNYSSLGTGSTLPTFHACWLGTLMDSTALRIHPPHATSDGGSTASLLSELTGDSSSWSAPIVLRTNHGISRLTVLGVSSSTTERFDPCLDFPAPPRDPDGLSSRLLIDVEGEPPATGRWLYRDIRPQLLPGSVRSWQFTIQPGEEEQMDIDFRELLAELPTNIKATVILNSQENLLSDIPIVHWRIGEDQPDMSLMLESIPPEVKAPELPTRFTITAIWPNPFNRTVMVELAMPVSTTLVLEVFDVLGRLVERRNLERRDAGVAKILWEPDVASGMYLFRVRTATGETAVRRVVLLR